MNFHRHLDDELNELRDRVLLLGGEAERALERAMYALMERDNTVAREVLAQLLLPLRGQRPLHQLRRIGALPHPRAPLMDENVADQHTEIADHHRGPEVGHALCCQCAGEQEDQILADRRAEARCRQHGNQGDVGEFEQELR